MSALRKLPESGCILYGLFLMWIGVLVGLPSLIWNEDAVIGSCLAGMCLAMILPTILEQFKVSFVKDYPLTTIHLCYTFAYCIAMTIYVIGGEDAKLYASILVGLTALVISFVIDIVFLYKEGKLPKRKLRSMKRPVKKGFNIYDEFSIHEHINLDGVSLHEWKRYRIIGIDGGNVFYRDDDAKVYMKKYEDFIEMSTQSDFSWEE